MKKSIILFALLPIAATLFAQAPQKFSSQIVVRGTSGDLITESPVQIRITIIQGEPEGFLELQEIHSLTTNVNGLASFEIGAGTWVFGFVEAIDWSNGPYFIQTEVDPTNSSNYTISSTTELLSVPYALYAQTDDDWTEVSNTLFVIDKSIGIGTSSPEAPLHVEGPAMFTYVVTEQSSIFDGVRVGRGAGGSTNNIVLGGGLLNNTSGMNNTAIGNFALHNNNSGGGNTAIGSGAGVIGQNLNNTSAIGANAKAGKSNSVILGNDADVGIRTSIPNEALEVAGNGRAFFGNGGGANRTGILIDGDWITNATRIESYDYGTNSGLDLVLNDVGNGDVGIKVSNPNVSLDVSGSIEYTGTITDVSDERLKENFESIDNALESITQLQGYSYNMKDDEEMVREYGVIAQEVQKVFPEMVTVVDEEEGYLGVSYVQLIPVLLEAIKELEQKNQDLESENQEQSKLIETNTELMRDLKQMMTDSSLR